MNKKQKEKIREQIQEEIEKTEILIYEYKTLIKPIVPDCAIDNVSRMNTVASQDIPKEALLKAQKKLQNLLFAQKNIDNKGFGICARCGANIPLKRILLVPQSKYCVKCAQ